VNTINLNAKEPMNVRLLDPMKVIESEGLLPVTTYMIHEPSTNKFHPDGLFSEVIFGPIGSTDRLTRFGYIDLKTDIFNPTIYENLLKLSSLYGSILEGKAYAIFNKETMDFELADKSNINANTGFTFFMEHLHKINFKSTGSLIRDDRIEVLNKYNNLLTFNKLLVSPAGTRDIKEDSTGKMSMENINKLYLSILALANSLPDDKDALNDPVFDSVKYTIQMKVMEIYEYILKGVIGGKNGYGQGKFGARNIILGARNVITAAPLTEVKSPLEPNYFRNDESLIPLYQCMKSAMPLVQHYLMTIMLNSIFSENSTGSIPLINPNTYELEYMDIDEETRALYTTSDGTEKLINKFDNEDTVFQPFAIQVISQKFKYAWVYLVYDLNDRIYIFRNLDKFKEGITNVSQWKAREILINKNIDISPLNGINYCITGGIALEMYGYKDIPSNTLDILVDPITFDKLKTRSDITTANDLSYLILNNIFIHKENNFKDILKSSVSIEGYSVVNMETLATLYKSNIYKDTKYKFKYKWLNEHIVDMRKVRPLTNVEMFYIVTYMALKDKYTTFSRYPILHEYGILTTKVAVHSTEPNRVVKYMSYIHPEVDIPVIILPRYPVIHNSKLKGSMSPHPSTLSGYDGDFDGDVCSAIILLSEDTVRENQEYFQRPISMVSVNNTLHRGLANDAINKFTYYNLGYMPK
jgi:hypothetical protein